MLEMYILIGLILATGSILVCDKEGEKKRMYLLIFAIIIFLWPAVAIAALFR